MVLSHQRRHLQLLRIRQQEAKWHRTSPGVGLCEGSYRRQLSPNTRNPADGLAPVSGGGGGPGVRGDTLGEGAEGTWGWSEREGNSLTQALPCPLCPVSLQSYLQSLREHQLGPGSQATAPHIVLDLDSDCGSTVPLTTPSGSTQT